MAAYSGTPTVIRRWEVGDRFGKTQEYSKDISLSLSTQGGLTNTIGRVALGFSAIYSVHTLSFTDGSSVLRNVGTFTDGSNIYTADPAVSTDADRGKAADVTGTLIVRVTGRP